MKNKKYDLFFLPKRLLIVKNTAIFTIMTKKPIKTRIFHFIFSAKNKIRVSKAKAVGVFFILKKRVKKIRINLIKKVHFWSKTRYFPKKKPKNGPPQTGKWSILGVEKSENSIQNMAEIMTYVSHSNLL